MNGAFRPSPRAAEAAKWNATTRRSCGRLGDSHAAADRPRPLGARHRAVDGDPDRARGLESFSASTVRHRRLSGALVRRHIGAEPRRGLRPYPQSRRAAVVLAGGARPVRAHRVDRHADAACAWPGRTAVAAARHHRHAVGAHHAALADRDPADRYFLRPRRLRALSAADAQRRLERSGTRRSDRADRGRRRDPQRHHRGAGAPAHRGRPALAVRPRPDADRQSEAWRHRANARRYDDVRRQLRRGQASGVDARRIRAVVRPHAAGRHRQEIPRRALPQSGAASLRPQE